MRTPMLTTILIAVSLSSSACRTLPKDPPRMASYAVAPGETGQLADVARELETQHGEGVSTFVAMDRNEEALNARLMLADLAEHTLDMQYFIWGSDDVGAIMLDRVFRAADRGVRVRLLVDDLLLLDRGEGAALVGDHPNIEVRIYNPWINRDGGWLQRAMEGAFDLDRVNHRMHNKVMVADNRAAIIGGRNIANAYFGLYPPYNFRDFDALVMGRVVPAMSKSFDEFWNSELAYPGTAIPRSDPTTLAQGREEHAQRLADAADRLQSFPLEPRDWSEELDELRRRMTPGSAEVVGDAPRESGEVISHETVESLQDLVSRARDEVLIAAAYLIPKEDGVDTMRELAERGVRVRILTNSLLTNDSTIAQNAYGRYRQAMLEAGVELYELRGDAADKSVSDTPPVVSKTLALHSKLIVVDRRSAYVGSANLDPRSMINSEVGLIVNAPEFAAKIASAIERDMSPANSWAVRLDANGKTTWTSSLGTLDESPAEDDFQRLGEMFVGILEDQL